GLEISPLPRTIAAFSGFRGCDAGVTIRIARGEPRRAPAVVEKRPRQKRPPSKLAAPRIARRRRRIHTGLRAGPSLAQGHYVTSRIDHRHYRSGRLVSGGIPPRPGL